MSSDNRMSDAQTWTVIEWGVIDGGLLGAVIACVVCEGGEPPPDERTPLGHCAMCNGDGVLHQPYRLPNGEPIDLDRHAEILIQIEPTDSRPDERSEQ